MSIEFKEVDEIVNSEPNKQAEKKSNKASASNGVVINCDYLRVRKEASLESDILGLLNKGDEIKITGSEKNFYKVLFNDNKGYCLKKFIKLVPKESKE